MDLAVTVLAVLVLLAYFVAILPDVALDVYGLIRRLRGAPRLDAGIAPERILTTPPKRLAILIPAWREAGVVAPMVEATLQLMIYPRDRVDLFVGVYPNDPDTLAEVEALSERHPNVHLVVNYRAGPTRKSQNLNQIHAAVVAFEEARGTTFDAVCVHDAEDVVHPYAFRLYSALLDEHEVVQLPVFVLLPPRGLARRLVAGTYVDEFSQSHLHHVPLREAMRTFVPSAGTGFAIGAAARRDLIRIGPLFNEHALTEDYELAIRLWALGHRVHFHLQALRRVNHRGRTVREYVGVGEPFPHRAAASIRQRARWIYGIALQTPRLLPPGTLRRLPLRVRLALWHDGKGRFTNLVHLIGYPLAVYLAVAPAAGWATGHTAALFPAAVVLAALTLERMVVRAWFVARGYGPWQGLVAGYLPPLLPLRWLVGIWIGTRATLRAWRLHATTSRAGVPRGQGPRWDKTARRDYVSDEVLARARRRLGDHLVFAGDLSTQALSELVRRQESGQGRTRLGAMAVEDRLVEHHVLAERLGDLGHVEAAPRPDGPPVARSARPAVRITQLPLADAARSRRGEADEDPSPLGG